MQKITSAFNWKFVSDMGNIYVNIKINKQEWFNV